MSDGSSEDGVKGKKFGMMSGVFIPTLLTILGVIMFLRLGWVVGSVGLVGSWAIIGLAFLITGATALSMSSIITNMKIGPGGVYSIISRSLGLEAGGSIGVPLYISLALSMVMYIFGFREGLRFIFPKYSALLIDFLVFGILFIVVLLSTKMAFKIQYVILAIVVASIIAVFLGGRTQEVSYEFTTAGRNGSFWVVFAVFFPAATGIMAGANMSGELKEPKKAIPIGTLAAIGVSMIIYMALAYWLAGSASPDELMTNFMVMIERSYYGPLVLAGLLAATFSQALNSIVGATRILQAMGEHNILPGGNWFSKKAATGEPRNAILMTGVIVVLGLFLRDLDTVAPVITMFFLLTYAIINVIILLEHQLELVSFRPLLKIPIIVPLVGTFGCFLAMFIINPAFSFVAVVVVGLFYYALIHRHLESKSSYGDVRSSLFVALAEWAAKKSNNLPKAQQRAWVPNILVPTKNPSEIRGVSSFLRDIAYPRGSVSMVGVGMDKRNVRIENQFKDLSKTFKKNGIYSDWTIIEGKDFKTGAESSMQTLKRSLFSPNIAFLRMPDIINREKNIEVVMKSATENRLGIILFADHPTAGLGQEKRINIWLPKRCQGWSPPEKPPNCNLALLIAYKLKVNWHAELNILVPTEDEDVVESEKKNIERLIEAARIPVDNVEVKPLSVEEWIGQAPQADLNIFSLPPKPDFDLIRERIKKSESTCIYCRDSAVESVLA